MSEPRSPPGRRRVEHRAAVAGWQWALLAAGALLVFSVFNLSVLQKERLLARGAVVRLALAPRDPRSFLTGDYMALNYALANDLRSRRLADRPTQPGRRAQSSSEQLPVDGYLIVSLDKNQVAKLVRLQPEPKPVTGGEYALRYRIRDSRVQLGTNAFFFEEGTAEHYESARYGEYRVDASGAMLLIRMLNDRFEAL